MDQLLRERDSGGHILGDLQEEEGGTSQEYEGSQGEWTRHIGKNLDPYYPTLPHLFPVLLKESVRSVIINQQTSATAHENPYVSKRHGWPSRQWVVAGSEDKTPNHSCLHL